MNVAQSIQSAVAAMPTGQIFGYDALPDYSRSPSAVIKAVSRMVKDEKLSRFAKGKFFVPQKGLMGNRKPSDGELIRSVLYKNGSLRGYVSGYALFNRLGLTTQVPKTIVVAVNGGRQIKDFGRLSIQTVPARAIVSEANVTLLGYLDVLKDIKTIPDTTVSQSMSRMVLLIKRLTPQEKRRLVALALEAYPPQVRALLGVMSDKTDLPDAQQLKLSLNPTTVYKLRIEAADWPNMKDWNIR